MKTKILVVDDEQLVRNMLSRALEHEGYQILTARNAEEGIKTVTDEEIALVIADIKMPGMDGVTMLERIKKASQNTEVIMMTGFATMENAIQSLKYGAVDFLSKPFGMDDAAAIVKKAVGRYHMKKAEAMCNNTVTISLVIDAKHNIVKINTLLANYLAYETKDLAGAPVQKIFGKAFWRSSWADFIRTPQVSDFAVAFQTRYDIPVELFFSGTIIKDDSDNLVFIGVGKKK